MAITIDWPNSIIHVPKADMTLVQSVPFELRELDTNWFRLELRKLEDDVDGRPWQRTHDHNADVTVGGITLVDVLIILAPYTITFEDGQYGVVLTGTNNNILERKNFNQVSVSPSNSAGYIQIETGSGVTEQDKLDIADRVWDEDLSVHSQPDSASTAVRAATYVTGSIHLDTVNGSPGVAWPAGTSYQPCDNLTEALQLANFAHLVDIILGSDITVGATHDISRKMLRSLGLMGIDVVLAAGCTANSASFRNINLSGVVTAGDQLLIYDCSIGSLENFRGIMNNVSFAQGAEITLNGWATIIQATAGGEPTNEVEIDIGTAALNMSHWTGNLKLKGKTGTGRTVINCDSGNIIIDATCTAGIIQLIGTGQVERDDSGPGCTVDTDALQNVDNVVDGVWDEQVSQHENVGTTGEKLSSTPSATENADAVWNKELP